MRRWTISIDDLRVYSDIFTNPLQFLHFVEQRNNAFSASIINAEDELDHLGLYLKHNCYVQYAKDITSDIAGDSPTRLEWLGYRQKDESFNLIEYTLANIYIANEINRILLEIFFDENLEIMDIKYSQLSSQDINEQKGK